MEYVDIKPENWVKSHVRVFMDLTEEYEEAKVLSYNEETKQWKVKSLESKAESTVDSLTAVNLIPKMKRGAECAENEPDPKKSKSSWCESDLWDFSKNLIAFLEKVSHTM